MEIRMKIINCGNHISYIFSRLPDLIMSFFFFFFDTYLLIQLTIMKSVIVVLYQDYMSSAVCSVKNVDDQVDVTQSDTQSVAVLEKPHLACKQKN